ncbi:hypothetical protein [uncultured Clostridium sp.]|jgi:hypothetical protein|uniref:hypothetical protein n=1 Tax=uncultured Clostridium sp. TaxID=59620 RepID=UPI00262E7418|nr:hypothetical protein [uncultured Clostridium sp.]
MGIMQREVRNHKISVAIVQSIVFVSFMIFVSGVVGQVRLEDTRLEVVTDPIFIVATVIAILLLFKNSSTSYKYSVIADQLIVHKVTERNQSILENIKVGNILYVGRDESKIKKFKACRCKKYTCSIRSKDKYCCVYEVDGKVKKFYFEASNNFVEKIEKLKLRIEEHKMYV